MADIIRLRGSPHETTQELLPWYINGTLTPEEAALVEAHLAGCDQCREELASERALATAVTGLPLDAAHGWAAMSKRLDAATPAAPDPGFVRRRSAVGWAMGSAAVAAALVLAVSTSLPRAPAVQTYHALGSAPSGQPGNIVVQFKPEASEQQMRLAMIKADARLVDGPSENGSYVLSVPAAGRGQAVAQLRTSPQVLLAEPIDADVSR